MKLSDGELKKIISRLSGASIQTIDDDTTLIEDLHMDSLKIVELLAILSEEYKLSVTEEDVIKFHTYKDLYDFTQR
ncbi:acyl carrier protein [Legionella nagasakiensis]|uniref:acyl carrier protein n=1 Tax=Legionella nagasakiensis TaxID=535290 RepID=UPI00105475DC|nr:acyl carrier protein [Legionella nagasakiensis]